MHYTTDVSTETTQTKTVAETATTRTSVIVPTPIWEELRICAIRNKLSAGEAVEAAIRLWIEQSASAEKKRRA
jgi:hypothetical protein